MRGFLSMFAAAPVKPTAASEPTRITRAFVSRRFMRSSRSMQRGSASAIVRLPSWMAMSPSGSGSAPMPTMTSFSERYKLSRRTTACSRRPSAAADAGRSAHQRQNGGRMAVRRPVVILVLMLLVLPGLVLHASGKPITTMAHGPKGNVEFETLTLNASDFWDGVKTGQRVTISGELLLPKGEGRVPVVVLSHGGGGVGRAEDTWARELRSQGIAVFVVDSFTGRGIKKFPPETELSRAGQVYDVYQALALLATHPRVDAGRIALMGGSRGGGLSILAAMTRSLKAQAPANLEFCAYLAIYPTIRATVDYGTLASRPIRLFTGTADEATSITTVRDFAERQRTAGANVKLFEYEGAHHAFDNPQFRTPIVANVSGVMFTVAYHPQAHAKLKKDMRG